MLIVILFLLISTNYCYSDTVLDLLVSAVKSNANNQKIADLKRQYGGTVVNGKGYVTKVDQEAFTVYVTIIVNKSDLDAGPYISLEIPENGSYYDLANNLKENQKVSFSGKFNSIFAGTIYLIGDVTVSAD